MKHSFEVDWKQIPDLQVGDRFIHRLSGRICLVTKVTFGGVEVFYRLITAYRKKKPVLGTTYRAGSWALPFYVKEKLT